MESAVIIEAHGVQKYFGSTLVLGGVDVNVYRGEILAIMGPSGSGKSTLLHCLAGIIKLDGGNVVYDGNNIGALSQGELTKLRRTDFGFIFQFGELVSELPVRENVALPLLLRGTRKRQAYKIADSWLDAVGMQDFARTFPHMLSGGELQRVAIARAMAIDPKVIFADEPTGSLDSVNSKNVMKLFVSLAKEYDKAVVIVTHSYELATYADRTILLRDGMIIDSHEAI